MLACALIYARSPSTNFVFDEQEALLANPYVNGQLGFWEAFRRDFWGLPPDRSIGSYRPLPNVLWRLLWPLGKTPFFAHLANLLLHATNAALLATLVLRWTGCRRRAWLSAAALLGAAVATEAVSGVVGVADVLAGTALLAGLHVLHAPLWARAPLAFVVVGLGLLAKESALTALVVLPWSAWVLAPLADGAAVGGSGSSGTRRAASAALVLLGAALAIAAYVLARQALFSLPPAALPAALEPPRSGLAGVLERFEAWFRQPRLPIDPINNPLVLAEPPERVAGALGVFARGLLQALVPWRLSGDYSFAEERAPTVLVGPDSVVGAAALVLAPLLGVWLARRPSVGAPERPLLAWLLVWVPVTYFPHSNVLVLLPTIRAERLWYVPLIAIAVGVALALARTLEGAARGRRWLVAVPVAFFAVQLVQARRHAAHFDDDLTFWRATVAASPLSAKAHLNYGVMLGARGFTEARLEHTRRALELAPQWPMAAAYYADALCRDRRADEAWPYYRQSFERGPNEAHLIALGLQCLWDEGRVSPLGVELEALAAEHPGTWLEFLVGDLLANGHQHGGVQPRYRPRAYDEGPREGSG